jgi:hypothetical protein
MAKKVSCGSVSETVHNYTDDKARAEIKIESSGGSGGCKGVTVRIFDESGGSFTSHFIEDPPAGPDLYEVPKKGRIEFFCGQPAAEKDDQHGECKVEVTVRWL